MIRVLLCVLTLGVRVQTTEKLIGKDSIVTKNFIYLALKQFKTVNEIFGNNRFKWRLQFASYCYQISKSLMHLEINTSLNFLTLDGL